MPTPTPLPYKAASAARPDDPVERRGMERWAFRLRHGESRCLVWPLFYVERGPQCSLLLVVQWTQLSAQSTRASNSVMWALHAGYGRTTHAFSQCRRSLGRSMRRRGVKHVATQDMSLHRRGIRHAPMQRHKTCTEVQRRRKLHTLAGKACGVVLRH